MRFCIDVIEKIKTGDSVWSYNIELGKTELNSVENVFGGRTPDSVIFSIRYL